MGEAKRRKAILTEAPCICGSLKPARECRFDGLNWHKAPSALGLKSLPRASIVEKCYMKELGSCDGGISGEHLISESIILLLAADGDFTISGLPWIPPGEFKTIGPKSLTANCLCSKHSVGVARASIGRYLDFYNRRRPHSSLDRRTPDEAYFGPTPCMAAA